MTHVRLLFSRLKLAHQLSLILAGAALLAVLAMSTVVSWNLRAGFSDYIAARDTPQLERLAVLIAKRSINDPELLWLRGSREGMESLLTDLRGFERGVRPPPPDSIEGWIQIYDAQDEWLAGRPQAGKPSMTWPVKVQGALLANIYLYRTEPTSGVDFAFLQRQYLGLSLAGIAVLLVSLVTAWWSARRWVRPLHALQNVTKRVAAGDLSQRTEPQGAQEIAALMTDVNSMTESLDKLQKARRLWIAQISHELRTPLSVLRGELEAVQDGARQPNEALIRNLLGEVMHLGRLVGDLHTLSMADVGQLHCEFQMQEFSGELFRIASRYVAIAESHGLRLHIGTATGQARQGLQGDITAKWDLRRITQVFTNLLSNSVRYTDAPGEIHIDWQVKQRIFELTIEDSAPTVPERALEQMFEPLYRADAARTRKFNDDSSGLGASAGSGLGLAIVRAIVQAHRGSVVASLSSLGGIKITLTLPLDPSVD